MTLRGRVRLVVLAEKLAEHDPHLVAELEAKLGDLHWQALSNTRDNALDYRLRPCAVPGLFVAQKPIERPKNTAFGALEYSLCLAPICAIDAACAMVDADSDAL